MKAMGKTQIAEHAAGNGNGAADSHKRSVSESDGVKTFTPGEPLAKKPAVPPALAAMGLRPEEVDQIKRAIAQAKTLEEVERLTQMLRQGQIPSNAPLQEANGNGAEDDS